MSKNNWKWKKKKDSGNMKNNREVYMAIIIFLLTFKSLSRIIIKMKAIKINKLKTNNNNYNNRNSKFKKKTCSIQL
jgi:hypothetical protein